MIRNLIIIKVHIIVVQIILKVKLKKVLHFKV